MIPFARPAPSLRLLPLLMVALATPAVADTFSVVIGKVGEGRVSVNNMVFDLPYAADFTGGTSLQLAPAPAEGWEFLHWSGDISSTVAAQTLTVNGNKNLTLAFRKVVAEYRFPTGVADWRLTGLWHLETNSRCNTSGMSSQSNGTAVVFNQESDCDYDTGAREYGYFELSRDLTLPPQARSAALIFKDSLESETQQDFATVEVSTDGGRTWSATGFMRSGNEATWNTETVDLSPHIGQAIRVRFFFDTGDAVSNAFFGWYVDDVKIVYEVLPPTQRAVWINSASRLEGAEGLSAMQFAINVSPPHPTESITLTFETADDTAIAGQDYVAKAGNIVVPPNVGQTSVSVNIQGDLFTEVNERFFVRLLTADRDAIITVAQATGAILDDDRPLCLFDESFEFALDAWTETPPGLWHQQAASVCPLSAPGYNRDPQNTGKTRAIVFNDEAQCGYASSLAGTYFFATNANLPLPLDALGASLTFFHSLESELDVDQAFVQITTNDGATWSDLRRYSGDLHVWREERINLSAYLGRNVRVRFGFTHNVARNNFNGWYIDDVRICVDPVPPGFSAISVRDVAVFEGNSGTTTAAFLININPPNNNTLSFRFATADGTATSEGPFADYVATSGTFNVAPTVTAVVVSVPVNGDILFEADETFLLNLSQPSDRAFITDPQAVGTIRNDDQRPVIAVANVAGFEGNAGLTDFTFDVTVTPPYPEPVSVEFRTEGQTASASAGVLYGADFVTTSGLLQIPPNTGTTPLTVKVNGDPFFESDEFFLLTLSGPSANAVISSTQGQATATILNDDLASICIFTESFESAADVASRWVLSSLWHLQDSSACPPSAPGYHFDAAATTQTEAMVFNVEGTCSYEAFAGGSAYLTMRNDAEIPIDAVGATLTFFDNLESEQGIDRAVVEVSTDSGQTWNPIFERSGDESVWGQETIDLAAYIGQKVRLRFGFIANASANNFNGWYLDDIEICYSPLPPNFSRVALANASRPEGNSGLAPMTFTVSLVDANGVTTTTTNVADIALGFATSNGTAEAGLDYVATVGQVVIPAGQNQATFDVDVIGDLFFEPDETFFVTLANLSTVAVVVDPTGVGTIANDDFPAFISISDVTATEGDGPTKDFVFTLTANPAKSQDIVLSYATADQTAVDGEDYTAASGTIVVPAGQTQVLLTIEVIGDTFGEFDETFVVQLLDSTVNGFIVDGRGLGTIVNDDSAPVCLFADGFTSGTGNWTLSGEWRLSSGNTCLGSDQDFFSPPNAVAYNNATSCQYSSSSSGFLTMIADVSIPIDAWKPQVRWFDFVGAEPNFDFYFIQASTNAGVSWTEIYRGSADAKVWRDRTADLSAFNGQNVRLRFGFQADAFVQDVGWFVDDVSICYFTLDPGFSVVSVRDIAVRERNVNSTADFTVQVSPPNPNPISLFFRTVEEDTRATAIPNADYVLTTGTLSIAAGATEAHIFIPIIGDLLEEPDEIFFIELSQLTGQAFFSNNRATLRATGTIIDNDRPAQLAISDVSRVEGDFGQKTATFVVTVSPPNDNPITVDFRTEEDLEGFRTAFSTIDYVERAGTLTIPAMAPSATIPVQIRVDPLPEGDETFLVRLANPSSNAVIVDAVGVGTIIDDDLDNEFELFADDFESGPGFWTTTGEWHLQANSRVLLPDNGYNSPASAMAYNSEATRRYSNTSGFLTLNRDVNIPNNAVSATLRYFDYVGAQPSADFYFVQVSTDGGVSWADEIFRDSQDEKAWNLEQLDLLAFRDKAVRVRFGFSANATIHDVGWYIDDVQIVYELAERGLTYFADDFESGDGQWTRTGLWHLEDASACISPSSNSPTHAMVFNTPGSCFYPNFASGSLITVDPIALPPGLPDLKLEWWDYIGAEPFFDFYRVFVSTNNGVSWTLLYQNSFDRKVWTRNQLSLAAYSGQSIRLRFDFTSDISIIDVGWWIDDVKVFDDPGPQQLIPDGFSLVSIDDVTGPEGNSGVTNYVFTVSFEPATPAGPDLQLQFRTEDGTATVADADYEETAGTLTIPAGTSSLTITVPVIGDTKPEPDERFAVVLRNPSTPLLVTDNRGIGTILTHDFLPGTTFGIHRGRLSRFDLNNPGQITPVTGELNADYLAGDFAADTVKFYALAVTNQLWAIDTANGQETLLGSATPVRDPSERWADMAYDPIGNVMYATTVSNKGSELYSLNLNTGAATWVASLGPGSEVTGLAAHPGNGQLYAVDAAADVVIRITPPGPVTVNAADVPKTFFQGTNLNPIAGGVTSTLTVPNQAGRITGLKVGNFAGLGTSGGAGPPTITSITLRSPGGTVVTLATSAACNVWNGNAFTFDDAAATAFGNPCPPVASQSYRPVQALSAFNGENPSGGWQVQVAGSFPFLSSFSLLSWRVEFITDNSVTDVGGLDFDAKSEFLDLDFDDVTGRLYMTSFSSLDEAELRRVHLSNGSTDVIGFLGPVPGLQMPAWAIAAGNALPSGVTTLLSVDNVARREGDNQNAPMTFTVWAYPPPTANITVNFQTSGLTATEGTDYQPAQGTLTINSGAPSATFNVTIQGDFEIEGSPAPIERFEARLANPSSGVGILDGRGIGTIWDDDGLILSLKDIFAPTGRAHRGSDPQGLLNVNNLLYFSADDGTFRGRELWRSDGTEQGSVLVRDVNERFFGSSRPENLTAMGPFLIFSADDGVNGRELWRHDGTNPQSPITTLLAPQISAGAAGTEFGDGSVRARWPSVFHRINNDLNFRTLFVNARPSGQAPRLYKVERKFDFIASTMGQPAVSWSLTLLQTPTVTGPTQTGPLWMTPFDDGSFSAGESLFYSHLHNTGPAGANERELWRWRRTPTGDPRVYGDEVAQISDVSDMLENDSPSFLTVVGQELFFAANDGATGLELWKTAGGTLGSETQVKDINLIGGNPSIPRDLVNVNGTLFFSADDGVNGRELWKSDGTPQGTRLVKDINPNGPSNPSFLTPIGSTLFFAANDGVHGIELWKSDGTADGTVLVTDLDPNFSSSPRDLVGANRRVFFSAYTSLSGRELWESDGTIEGTVLVRDLAPGRLSSDPKNLTIVASYLFFSADNRLGFQGRELYLYKYLKAFLGEEIEPPPGLTPSGPPNVFKEDGTQVTITGQAANGPAFWSQTGKLFATQTGLITIDWQFQAEDGSIQSSRVIVKNEWPTDPSLFQTHVAQLRIDDDEHAVDLTAGGEYPIVKLWHSDNLIPSEVQLRDRKFAAIRPGRSLVMLTRTEGNNTLNFFQLIRTVDWTTNLISGKPAPIGEPITDFEGIHDAAIGQPLVLFPKARVNVRAGFYSRANRSGVIIPVNLDMGLPGLTNNPRIDPLVLVFYQQGSRLREADTAQFVTTGRAIAWPIRAAQYDPFWPNDVETAVIATMRGTGSLSTTAFPNWTLYVQDKFDQAGFNPNDEHAVIRPANGGAGSAIFPLRDDLALRDGSGNPRRDLATSEPYILIGYRDAQSGQGRMKVWKVVAEQNPFFFRENPAITPSLDPFEGTAGAFVQLPYPLTLIFPLSKQTHEFVPPNSVARVFVDRKQSTWVVAAGDDGGPVTFTMRYFYPWQAEFYDPYGTHQVGDDIPWLSRTSAPSGTPDVATPNNVVFTVRWPTNFEQLFVGETQLDQLRELPDIDGQCSVDLAYQQSVALNQGSSAELMDPLRERAGTPGLINPTQLVEITPTEIRAGRRFFTNLPPHLKPRVSYDEMSRTLNFKGLKITPALGDPWILPNIMTEKERDILLALHEADVPNQNWINAVNDLYTTLLIPVRVSFGARGEGTLELNLLSDPTYAETFPSRLANFGFPLDTLGLAGSIQFISESGACTATFTADQFAGKVVFVERTPSGLCLNANAVRRLQAAGAKAVVFVGPTDLLVAPTRPQDNAAVADITIPSMAIRKSDGDKVKLRLSTRPALLGRLKKRADAFEYDSLALSAGNAQAEGFVSLVFANAESCGDLPISVEILRVSCPLAKARLQQIKPDCPFDEKLTMRFTGDLAGRADDYDFEWYAMPVAGPEIPTTTPDDPNSGWLDVTSQFAPTPPPGQGVGWGLNDITIRGPGIFTLSDNWFICRYRPIPGRGNTTCPEPWSPWTDPSVAEGWIKRIIGDINPFTQRAVGGGIEGAESAFSAFRDRQVNTIVNMLQQAGPRWMGNVPLNCQNLDGFGLIEVYETVLNRGRTLSIDALPPVDYQPANNALLLAASRIADLYLLFHNEAFADAADPTVGIGTDNPEFGAVASSIHSFMNQAASLIEEELGLLRGRDDQLAPGVELQPVFNRLIWNFTGGPGEVAYVLNYDIRDAEIGGRVDGILDENDARSLYPQGHGDAWGHALKAIKIYYELLRHPFFTWVPRAETVKIGGADVAVDFLDERKFAQAAVSKARTGAEIVNLTYRSAYTEDPQGQWQGYKDTIQSRRGRPRAWGVAEWASRAGQGAYFDWVAGNAILPPEAGGPPDIRKIDRQTVKELGDVARAFDQIQIEIDKADRGLNPLGLAKNVVPFDIDPNQIDQGRTHFEQIYDRAVTAMNNAITVFNVATAATQQLRRQADELAAFQSNVRDREADFAARLVEIFGTPYTADIGVGKTYPPGYTGPDLIHYMYIDPNDFTPRAETGTITFTQRMKVQAGRFVGSSTIDANSPKWQVGDTFPIPVEQGGGTKVLQAGDPEVGQVKATFTTLSSVEEQAIEFHLSTSGLGFVKPAAWGDSQRRVPGDIQIARSDLLQAIQRFEKGLGEFDELIQQIDNQISTIRDTANINSDEITILTEARTRQLTLTDEINNIRKIQLGLRTGARAASLIGDAVAEFWPTSSGVIAGLAAGVIGDFFAPGRGATKFAASVVSEALNAAADLSAIAENNKQRDKEDGQALTNIRLQLNSQRKEIQGLVAQLEQMIRQKSLLLMEINTLEEQMKQMAARYAATLNKGESLLDEREAFRVQNAAEIQLHRYKDMAYRIVRNDAVQKYRAQFDLAAMYVYLAARAYDFETNLLSPRGTFGVRSLGAGSKPSVYEQLRAVADRDPQPGLLGVGDDGAIDSSQEFLTAIIRSRSLGQVRDGLPQTGGAVGDPGLADPLARMNRNWELVLRGQLGFNNPQTETNRFSFRAELFRIQSGLVGNETWRETLQRRVVNNILDLPEFQRYARPFFPTLPAEPAIVIPFATTINFGMNFFGWPLGGGDSAYDSTHFATKVRSVGVWFSNYNNLGGGMSNTPRVYLFPVGADVMRSPSDDSGTTREWKILDQRLPPPFPIGENELSRPNWVPRVDSLDQLFGTLGAVRRFSMFRAFHDSGSFSTQETINNNRLIGRSVWNTRWLLIIPAGTLHSDRTEGLQRFINGGLLPGETAPDGRRNGNGVTDIKIFFQTYAYSGN